MSERTRYWLSQARFGLVIALGAIFALFQWQAGNTRIAVVASVITVVAAVLVYLLVDRPRARGLRAAPVRAGR